MITKALKKDPITSNFKNVLGLLSPNDSYKLRPNRLLEITGYSKAALAKELRSSRPLMYKDEVDLRTMKQIRDGIFQMVIVSDLIFELFKFNEPEMKDSLKLSKEDLLKLQGETERWLMSPNQLLFGKSPFEVCISGEGKELIMWLASKLGIDTPASDK